MNSTLLRVILCGLWMFGYGFAVSYLPKSIETMLAAFPIGFIVLFLIMFLFRDKDTKTTEEQH